MKVTVTAFGIAKDILNKKQTEIEYSGTTVADLRQQLIERFPEFAKLASLKFAVNTDYVSDDFVLNSNDEVVLIPPVSGG
ncbi:MoaD/ThiS family protein [Roseivirga pacifica]|uniref:MoaD/ThiS family protein n=1 Tax=Roseivirga pacifica TaxID=1267423 RepID=UPI003BB1169E